MTILVDRPCNPSDPVSDGHLFARTMQPYASKGTVYLVDPAAAVLDGQLHGRADFRIPEPCYIDDTGHFNAAEFVICYNQLMYYTLAAAVRDRLIPAFEQWTMEQYWAKQLPDVLIARLDSSYSRPINSAGFQGEFVVTSATERVRSRRMLILETEVRFFDDHGGRASGLVKLAIIDPPPAA